jgi:hypothetical protein
MYNVICVYLLLVLDKRDMFQNSAISALAFCLFVMQNLYFYIACLIQLAD